MLPLLFAVNSAIAQGESAVSVQTTFAMNNSNTTLGSISSSTAYIKGVCDSQIPSTWHVRSSKDQAIWNKEGKSSVPLLTANKILQILQKGDIAPFKPSVFSIADADTTLAGHSINPASESANRNEIDVLQMTGKQAKRLLSRISHLTHPINNYYAENFLMDGQNALKIRNVKSGIYSYSFDGKNLLSIMNSDASKYYGMELIIIDESAAGKNDGFIFYNRSNDAEMEPSNRSEFRKSAEHFFETIKLSACPNNWRNQ